MAIWLSMCSLMHLPGNMTTERQMMWCGIFPLTICNTCGLEDISVTEIDLAMRSNMLRYMEESKTLPRSKQPAM